MKSNRLVLNRGSLCRLFGGLTIVVGDLACRRDVLEAYGDEHVRWRKCTRCVLCVRAPAGENT